MVQEAHLTAAEIEAITKSMESLGLEAVIKREDVMAAFKGDGLSGLTNIIADLPSHIT